ncbi:MAG: Asp23/Gls24 family envelope stress response protein [Firmicutes bacterium]|nr:Asp23/Gls24 family envelope stress response protein [Bacillota bacterium]
MDEEIKNVQETEEQEETLNEEAEAQEAPEAEAAPEEEPIGNIKISVDVVSTIAGIATSEVEGVAGMSGTFAGGIAEMFGAKKNPSKGVKVDMTETSVTIDLYIVVDYGVRIPELSWEIQENVKNNVETMTGLDVLKVNIHIEGVSFEKEKEETIELDSDTSEQPDEESEEYTAD